MAWKTGLQLLETCTMAGTSSSTIFSNRGYQYRSVSGGEVHFPPLGSGLRLQPTKPSLDAPFQLGHGRLEVGAG